MNGTIKDILNISGVQGYVLASGKNFQIKLPAKHKLATAKERLLSLYKTLAEAQPRPGNTIEIYLEDVIITIFLNGPNMLLVSSSSITNMALLRMTGKLVLANIIKER